MSRKCCYPNEPEYEFLEVPQVLNGIIQNRPQEYSGVLVCREHYSSFKMFEGGTIALIPLHVVIIESENDV